MRNFYIPWKWNVPNALSLLRILLVPVFMVLYLTHHDTAAFVVLLLSGVTDVLDGYIARKFNQITDCGKLLDPLSDKLTQVAVVISLTTRYPTLLPLTILCLIKEVCQGIGGVILLCNRSEVRGSQWFGKLSTVIFYVCMLVLVLWPGLPKAVEYALIGVSGGGMLLAFIGYLLVRRTISGWVVLPYLVTCVVIALLFPITGTNLTFSTLTQLCSGYVLFAAAFLINDPVTTPRFWLGRLFYGCFTACLVMLLQRIGQFEAGTCFAILIMNALSPIIDRWSWHGWHRLSRRYRIRKEVKAYE